MIKKDEKIKDLIKNHPEATQVFLNYGLRCSGCPAFNLETIEEAAQSHGIELESFLLDINEIIEKKND